MSSCRSRVFQRPANSVLTVCLTRGGNPILDFNRGGKFELYRELPSLKDYVLVSQTAQRVEVYHRTAEGDWLLKIYDGPEATAQFPSLDAAVALSEIYGDILTPAAE